MPLADQIWELFGQLRRRGLWLGLEDHQELRQALRSGFGLSSRQALCELCCLLWAKSRRDQEVVRALFARLFLDDWVLPELVPNPSPPSEPETPLVPDQGPLSQAAGKEKAQSASGQEVSRTPEKPPVVQRLVELRPPPITERFLPLANRPFVFVRQFPLTYREVAQAWRRLRRPVHCGPPVDLDVEATITRWCRQGVAAGVVRVPRRRNTARLLLLVDRQGSMAPYHDFLGEVCRAILQSGRLERAACYYFHDVPAQGADPAVLRDVPHSLFPSLDAALPLIEPLTEGDLYRDAELLAPVPLEDVLAQDAPAAAMVLFSDGGAARRHRDTLRLLDTLAFFKALRVHTNRYVWLNPAPPRDWPLSNCAELARHVPMFPLDPMGIYHAVNVLRGQVYPLERPL